MDEWNLLQAVLRKVSGSCRGAFVLAILAVVTTMSLSVASVFILAEGASICIEQRVMLRVYYCKGFATAADP